MKLFGTVKYFFEKKGLVSAYAKVKMGQKGTPYLIGYYPNNEQEQIFFTSSLANEVLEGMDVTKIGLKKCVMWETETMQGEKVYRIGKMKSLNTYEPYEELLKNSTNLKYVEKLRALEWRDKREKIIERENGLCEICYEECIIDLEDFYKINVGSGENFQLKWANVHHTYYMNDALPWHYPDESLKLLCMGCHQDLHEKTIIKVYKDYTFSDEQDVVTCNKCSGTGYLPEYYYYYNGVCFSCNGTGFENL